MKLIKLLCLVTLGAFFASCASVAPKELVNARSAYHQASIGPAAEQSPAELHKAHEALIRAEKAFRDEPDSYKTRDLAYVAQRRAELAEAAGIMAVDKARQAKAAVDLREKQTAIIKQGKEDLRLSKQQAADMEEDLLYSEQQAADIEQELLYSEQQAAGMERDLRDAEKKTADALAELATLAALKEEKRGLVLTLPGAILFRSAESALLPTARVKLEQVADALIAIDNRKIIVEGHTDSMGSEPYNQNLSQNRAYTVRNFLVQRGYPADFIKAIGKGENSPVADNASAEGRANNRRVEIVIERELTTSNSYTSNE